MPISAIAAASNSGSVQQTTTTSTSSPEMNGLGQDAFLTLLLAQLQNQDPLKPMEDADFIAQLAQFNSLSELTEMNDTLEQLVSSQKVAEGSALIGRIVTGLSTSSELVTGLVKGLYLTDGGVMLDVDGETMSLDRVSMVQAPEPDPEPVVSTGT